ncbi:MAG: arylesterase [Proteobacteria bacterium]|nr:arylesterase [Pseudomonadota bacterium]MBU1056779.1 arylesterase [Pseudomonadota bacterium]
MQRLSQKNLARHPLSIISWLLSAFFLLSCDQQQETQPKTEELLVTPTYSGSIIAVGDSLTAGLGVLEDDAWPAILEKKLQHNGYHWQVINAGINGETSSGLLSRIKWILARNPEIVILETGANDGLRGIPPHVVRNNIDKTVQILQENNVLVVLAGMQIVQNLGADYTREFAAIYPSIAHAQDCILIPFFLQEVAGEPALNQDDTIHPNEKGHTIIAETVYPYVLQALQSHL